MDELIFYILLGIFFIFVIAYITDIIIALKVIKNRKDNYFNLSEFLKIINMTPINKEKRYNKYKELFDPVSKLVIESIGFNSNIYVTYSDSNLISKKLTYYLNNKFKEWTSGKIDTLNYINSEEFDSMTIWNDHPKSVLPFILDIPDYDEKNKLNSEQLNKISELLKDETIIKKIISNFEFKKEISQLIANSEKIKNTEVDDDTINYLDIKIKIYKLTLDSAYLKDNIYKKEILKK